MKKMILVLALVVPLSGCATVNSLLESRPNPITREALVTTQSGYGIVLSAAVSYRKLCADKVIARAKCAPVVAKLQQADRGVQVALQNLRKFVKENPNVDAISLVVSLKNAVEDFRRIAIAEGVSK